MTQRFKDYLTSIGMTEKAYLDKAELALTRAAAVSGQSITDILIEDVVQEDGTKKYEHFVAFTRHYIVSIVNFLTAETTAVHRLNRGVSILQVSTTSYDLKKATPESRIYVEFFLKDHSQSSWSLRGSGSNCDHIWAMTTKYIRKELANPA